MFDVLGMPPLEFLLFYAALVATALGVGALLTDRLHPEARDQTLTDPDLLALIAGGPLLLAASAVARLVADGALRSIGEDWFRSTGEQSRANRVEAAILSAADPARWRDLVAVTRREAVALTSQLVSLGLYHDSDTVQRLRWSRFAPLLVVFAVGTARLVHGMMVHHSVGFLIVMLAVTGALAGRACVVDRRTGTAVGALAAAQSAQRRLWFAPTSDETGLAVALFGPSVLAGSVAEVVHQMLFRPLRNVDSRGQVGFDFGGGACAGGGCGGGCGG